MKKLIAIILALIMALSLTLLAGCGDDDESSGNKKNASSSEAAEEEEEDLDAEKVLDGKWSLTIDYAKVMLADAEDMGRLLGLTPGSVSVLGLMNDPEHRVRLVIDRDLLKDETVSGHPGFSTTTVKLSREDLLRYVSAVGHEPTYVELAGE